MVTIKFEGDQGSGKSTAMELALLVFRANGYKIASVDEEAHTITVRVPIQRAPPRP